VSLKNLLHH